MNSEPEIAGQAGEVSARPTSVEKRLPALCGGEVLLESCIAGLGYCQDNMVAPASAKMKSSAIPHGAITRYAICFADMFQEEPSQSTVVFVWPPTQLPVAVLGECVPRDEMEATAHLSASTSTIFESGRFNFEQSYSEQTNEIDMMMAMKLEA